MTIRADGRWQGKLTSRPLPETDETVEALDEAGRAELSAVWHARAATERRVADSFVVIRDALHELGADASLVELADRAIDDEYRHAEICRVIASRYAGRDLDPPPPLELKVPRHPGASRRLELALWVVGQCCMNETIASAFLEAAVATASGPMAKGALRELLSDEIDHARLGWAFLGSLTPEERAEMGPWLFGMMRANLRMWRDSPRTYPMTEELAAQGAPSEEVVEDAIITAVRDLILPGLERFELPTEKIRAWLAEGAPTALPQ